MAMDPDGVESFDPPQTIQVNNRYIVMVDGPGRGSRPVAAIATLEPTTDAVTIHQSWDSSGNEVAAEAREGLEEAIRAEERRRRDERRTGKKPRRGGAS